MVLMTAALQAVGKRVPAILLASNRFAGFKPETEQPLRVHEVKMNPALEEMKKAWAGCIEQIGLFEDYADKLGMIKGIQNSKRDIECFSIAIAAFQGENRFSEKAGLMLSALMNSSQEDGFIIHTSHLSLPPGYLGINCIKDILVKGSACKFLGFWMERGSITVTGDAGDYFGGIHGGKAIVEGDCGDYAGQGMFGGEVIVMGNARNYAGNLIRGGSLVVCKDAGTLVGNEMEGGSIIIRGNAAMGAGNGMKGGKIVVEGDAGEGVGYGMEGGEIHVHGKIESIAENLKHGRIFHKGSLIFEK